MTNQGVRYINKLVLCGAEKVGKTSIRRNFMGVTFASDHLATLGADFAVKKIDLEDGASLDLQIWDLAGQAGFQGLRHRFFLGATSAFMVFDLQVPETFTTLPSWLDQLWSAHPDKDLPIAIIGNKIDLGQPKVSDDQVAQFIENLKTENNLQDNYLTYYKTSAKTGENIEKCFMDIAKIIIEKIDSTS